MLGKLFGFTKSYQDMDASAFEQAMSADKQSGLIDVRTPAEFKDGHIPGAKNIDVMGSEFASKVQNLDREKTWYVYCRSGGRSASACNHLHNLGFKNLVNLSGGIMGWRGKLKH